MTYEEYLKDKVFEYCDEKIKRGGSPTGWGVYQMLKNKDFWRLSSVLYGLWLRERSDYVATELSEQEW